MTNEAPSTPPPPEQVSNIPKNLEVEVDFRQDNGMVTLRLYELSAGVRKPLRLQEIFNLIQRLRRGLETGWPEGDVHYLQQLWPEVNKPHLLRANFQVLKVQRRLFARWLDQWGNDPNRFIERYTRKPFTKQLPKASLLFDLTCRGDQSTLAALVCPPKGTPIPYHQIRPAGTPNPNEILIRDAIMQLDTPIPRALLDEVFGQSVPTVPTEAIEDHLPVLLQGRLDLLRGRSVKHLRKISPPKLRLKIEGGDILIGLWIGPAPLMNPTDSTAYALRRQHNRFIVTQYHCDDLGPVQELLRKLNVRPASAPYVRVQATPEERAVLKKWLKRLPGNIQVEADDEVRLLISMPATMETTLTVRPGHGWFDVEVSCRVGNTELAVDEVTQMLSTNSGVVRTKAGGWLPVDPDQVGELRRMLEQTGTRPGVQRLTNPEVVGLIRGSKDYPSIHLHRSAQEIAEALEHLPAIGSIPLSAELLPILRPYQREGAEFLYNRTGYELGCILADDMGLGKTLQVLAYFDSIRDRHDGGKHLVVCPASVLSVWLRESEHFTPHLRVQLLTGPPARRRAALADRANWDVAVATYSVVRNDAYALSEVQFATIILDEAQQIKNPGAQITQTVKSLKGAARIAITGTPLENRLDDLWSIMDFLNPGYLGTLAQFQQTYCSSPEERKELLRRMTPVLLRRTKEQVAQELPSRTDETINLPLTDAQERFYREELATIRKNVEGRGVLEILAALTRLRQICCHPRLVQEEHADSLSARRAKRIVAPKDGESAKIDCLMEMTEELLDQGHSALVFSQFTRFLDIIEAACVAKGFKYFMITGETPTSEREQLVKDFNTCKEPAVFLLSLRAAGTGLTLTKADYVFICDPWWNPAVENQAIDRAHRIGQDKPVIAYRLVTENTVEDKVLQLQADKRQLFAEMIDGAEQAPSHLGVDEMIKLLAE